MVSASELQRLVPDAGRALCDMLDAGRGVVEPPIRSELFGMQRFAQHGRSLGETHEVVRRGLRVPTFFPRLRSNIAMLREAHQYIGRQASTGYDISPAAEWLLDNFHLIESQLKEIHDGLPRGYFRSLPMLRDEPLAGLPRIYGVAWAFVAHTDGAVDEALLGHYLTAYQETRELTLGEMWALPTTLRVVLIENLRRLAERIATQKAAREVANLCCDQLETYSRQSLGELLSLLEGRGVAREFLAQMAQRLVDRRASPQEAIQPWHHEWLHTVLPDSALAQTQQSADQAADNLSVSNAVTSLRAIGDADWPSLVAQTSVLMQHMRSSRVFEAETSSTRDQTLHGIERLARRSARSELSVAQTLLDCMRSDVTADESHTVASYWLLGAGRPTLLQALGLHEGPGASVRVLGRRLAFPVYLGSLALGTTALIAWMVLRHAAPDAHFGSWIGLLCAALMLFPASEAIVAIVNRLISESMRPSHLPRLALAAGIPAEHRVMVVVPAMLTRCEEILELAHRLELHYLANPEPHAQFALLSDWVDADTPRQSGDEELLASAREAIAELNRRYPDGSIEPGDCPRFLLLHRERQFSDTEQRWIGWERKRGKLQQLVGALADESMAAFMDLGDASRVACATRYLVTLDSDTVLPPGRLRELVGVAAHPHNQPRLDATGTRVVSGYAILQPRVVPPLPAPHDFTLYHWLFAGQCGIDPYSAASSEVYQDIFGEGTFIGKGLLNVAAMHAVLSDRLPEGRVLSHDLLEGSLARCAVVSDITVLEDSPFHADVAASRVHRWTRGDWQLLPVLLRNGRYRLLAVNRWKLFDNLRRSLVAPMSLALLVLTLLVPVISPWAALGLVFAGYCAGPLMGAVAGFSPSRDDLAKQHFYREAAMDLSRALTGGLWHLAQLLAQAWLSLDAIARSLYRLTVSHRLLLQWTTAAAAQASARRGLAALARQHWREPLGAMVLAGALLLAGSPHLGLALALCLVWGASPLWVWWVSGGHPVHVRADLTSAQRVYLEGVARDTWRLFERCVIEQDHHLPPDNLQTSPHDMVAHRTSPTNIGLYLLSAACARQFGWIGTEELLARLDATLSTLHGLRRHRGHLMNWYDTQTAEPLLPMYVSTVDSGNLSGHLLAVAQACRELADAPYDGQAAALAVAASAQRLACEAAHAGEWLAGLPQQAAARKMIAMSDPLAQAARDLAAFESLLDQADSEVVSALAVPDGAHAAAPDPSGHAQYHWLLADHLACLRSATRDRRAAAREQGQGQGQGYAKDDSPASRRLLDMAQALQDLAWAPDYRFLYHPTRRLFHIGYRVAEQQLDAGFYDLLASESRLTSLVAVAKGDVPVGHWSALGRPFYALGASVGLRSWAGSMFEYLMPTLVLREPPGSVLNEACVVAVREQIAFALGEKVPWGISESAYAGSDHTLAYQYAPQGVPRLALRRTPPDELVIAPYASALAAQIDPLQACANLLALQALGARARYGFIEALDFTSARQSGSEPFTRVDTFMSHHQGMSIVALANVLRDGVAQRWGTTNAHIEAVASTLHEKVPREVTALYSPAVAPMTQASRRRSPGLLREVLPGTGALEPTHVLSNGRYSVALRANGAGWSRWSGLGITRWRDDALRDAHGSFFYLRWDRQPQPVSITQHPAPDPAAAYQSVYHSDRVCFDAIWPQLQAHTTVWVSPEDDIEFRQIELRNLSNRPLEIELMSAFEVTLADPRADESHPAFTNLFVKARWQPSQQALLFERTPRLVSERGVRAAHFLAQSDPQVAGVRLQTDRQRWRGRNHDTSQPMAQFDALPDAADSSPDGPAGDDITLDTGLDPVCAMAVHLRIAPHGKAQLIFATAASDDESVLRAMIDKYRQSSHIQRASLMSATLTGIRLRALRIGAEDFAASQLLTTALALTLARPQGQVQAGEASSLAHCDRRLLWRLGLSGDRPILLVTAGAPQGLGLLRSLAKAMRVWAWGGIACDLVVVNAEPASYEMALHREISALRDRHVADTGAASGNAGTGFFVLRSDALTADEWSTLRCLARVRLHADGRPLIHHVQEWSGWHEKAFELRHDTSTTVVATIARREVAAPASRGEFDAATGNFTFETSAGVRPARPWINVLANPEFGAQLSEAGAGYSWALNSRLNQLTGWSNDPVGDPPSEWFLLQDLDTLAVWSAAPSAWGDAQANYQVVHGQGRSVISHRRGPLEVSAAWTVDPQSSVKQVRLRFVNRGTGAVNLRVTGLLEWVMGAGREDRASVQTALHRQRLPSSADSGESREPGRKRMLTALLCSQRERAAGFGEGTAFLAIAGAPGDGEDWTCDRRECFDARGRLVLPDHFGRRDGPGLDPCAALSVRVTLAPGGTAERVFLVGFGATPDAACQLATVAAMVPATQREDAVRQQWSRLLGATVVTTPDPLFDVMVNRWLLYQTVSCRLWAKAGFYQAGGATGFRDQLQDAMALTWAAPEMLRQQIVLCASRQFAEGDVQHWWHSPTGAGVRTHFSDDLLWLTFACAHYVRTTGDPSVLDLVAPFLEGTVIPDGAEDAYDTPAVSALQASVYEHAARAVDHSLAVGVHGLPLMGSGDWNDGMNRVGHEGRGESVWLAWFLCGVVAEFAPIARSRGESDRASRWETAAEGWRAALDGPAWDGEWYARAFFDNGEALGSRGNAEAQIDLIAQAWSVLSGAGSEPRQRIAMASMDKRLVDPALGLVKLLDPPLAHAVPNAGYIQAYPKGVRENGGQYNHGAVWALMAQAELSRRIRRPPAEIDLAYRYFTYLSPAHRANHPVHGEVYGIEPYVMAGDVYTQPPYAGRGGWSWYTGSAAWMHRAAVESIFGLQVRAGQLTLEPCLPSHWPRAELRLRRDARTLRLVLVRGALEAAREAEALGSVPLLPPGHALSWDGLAPDSCYVVPLPALVPEAQAAPTPT
jgi:cyclic beta-1,2-glucan synthetase